MKNWLAYAALVATALLPSAGAADLVLTPVGAFGEPLKGCRLQHFSSGKTTRTERRDYAGEFRGLSGRGIPLGEYDVSVQCGGSILHDHVLLNSSHQFELVVRRERVLVSEPTKPELVIGLDRPDSSATWWIELFGLYNHQRYIGEFEAGGRETSVSDPETGSYFVLVQSSSGYSCGRRIDLMEFTRHWSFDPSSCSFRVDQFAHVIEMTDSTGRDRWRAEMKDEVDRLLKMLQDAAGKK